ncbi:MAG TPA: tetratricopeptide repeat protein [Desulfobacterales bacterium]|nr:tetratricopeptide repeat protein [Desulfobacterales bacterium]
MMPRQFVFARCMICFLSLVLLALPAMAADTTAAKSRKAAAGPEPRDAEGWFRKGALVATYGNNKAAVGYFTKAIALDPNHDGAWFSRGVSYGQLGLYPQAVEGINRAIAMEPQNGLYYYGRARVLLLSGDREKARDDFRKAADLGDEDAQNYLKKNSK